MNKIFQSTNWLKTLITESWDQFQEHANKQKPIEKMAVYFIILPLSIFLSTALFSLCIVVIFCIFKLIGALFTMT